jgi:hypothetical protein
MINPQKGIDLFNNNSIISRIYFAVTIFQQSSLTRMVFYNTTSSGERERAATSSASRTLTDTSINHRKFFSSSILSSFTAWRWSSIIIIVHSMELE